MKLELRITPDGLVYQCDDEQPSTLYGSAANRGVYACLDANSHWLRMVREDGEAVGLLEKIAVFAGNDAWVLKTKRIDEEQPSIAIYYYEWLVFFAVARTDAEKEAIQLEIREMDEQAKQLGLRFHLQNQEVLLDTVDEEEGD